MPSHESLEVELSQRTPILGLKLWVVICIGVFVLLVGILFVIAIWTVLRRKKTKITNVKFPQSQIPEFSKEITVDRVAGHTLAQSFHEREGPYFPLHDRKTLAHPTMDKSSEVDNLSMCSSVYYADRAGSSHSGDEVSTEAARRPYSPRLVSASPLVGLPDGSHLGWGHWFTLRDLENATNRFCKENVIGEGGYGVVYKGRLINGMEVAIKKLLNNM